MALTLTRAEFSEAVEKVVGASEGSAYLDQFEFSFPEGLNTASVLEICRVVQDSGFEAKVRLLKICIAEKKVVVKCPDGREESFVLGTADDGLDGIPLFAGEPLALISLADTVYGHILKKSIRPSTARAKAAET